MSYLTDGNWGPWTTYSSCTTTCGKGLQIRSRDCNNAEPAPGGLSCQGEFEEVQYCNEQISCLNKGIILKHFATKI